MKRIVIYTVLACAVLAVSYLPPRPRTFDMGAIFFSPARIFARQLGSYARREADAIVLLAQRDTALARLEPIGTHFLFASAYLPPRLDSATRRLLRDPDTVSLANDSLRIGVAAFVDTVRRVHTVTRIPPRIRPRIYYLPPAATDGQTCLSVAAIGPDIVQQLREVTDNQLPEIPWNRGSLLGMCEYYHRFGRPSPAVEAWLLAGAIRYDGALQVRCARGELDACEALVFPTESRSPWGVTFAIWRGDPIGALPSFGAVDESFVQGIIDSLGVEPFERFWRSPRPVAESFEAAFGVAMVEWVRGWSRSRSAAGVAVGPRPGARLWLWIFPTIMVSLGWAVVARSGVSLRRIVDRRSGRQPDRLTP